MLEDILNGIIIYVFEDVVNLFRVLILLDSLGLIILKEGIDVIVILDDIELNFKFFIFEIRFFGIILSVYYLDGFKLVIMYLIYVRDINN